MRTQAVSMDFNQFSGVNALFTFAITIIVGVLTIAHNRRLTREELETSRREWSDVATRRHELNQSLQDQVRALSLRVSDLTGEMGELRKENQFLRDRNIELQAEVDASQRQIRQLQADLRRMGVDVTRIDHHQQEHGE